MEINTSLPYMQNLNSALNFNPIQSYNNTLKGSASFDVNKGVADNFDNILQQSMKAEEVAASRKFNNMSPVDSLMGSIEKAFGNGLNDVNEKKKASDAMQEAFARGEDVSVHDMMIASEKATLSLQMAMQIRNKMISAYTYIKNMNF